MRGGFISDIAYCVLLRIAWVLRLAVVPNSHAGWPDLHDLRLFYIRCY